MTQRIDKAILECVRAQASAGLEARLSPDNALAVLDYIDHLHGTVIELLSEQNKLKKDVAQTQYLSVLWIKMLDSFVPPTRKREAMTACAASIVEGMKQAGIKEYEAHLAKLEQQLNTE